MVPVHAYEDRTVIFVEIFQEWDEGTVQVVVLGDLAVAGRRRRHGDAGAGVDTAILTAHAASSTVQAIVGDRPDDQRQLKDQLLAAWDMRIDLSRRKRNHGG